MDISSFIVEHNPDGVLAFDRECRYTLWNAAMERMSGLPREQVIGRRAADVFPFMLETGEEAFFEAALAGETAVAKNRLYKVPETGRTGFYEGQYSAIRDESGAVIGGMAVIRDVTEREDAQARARESRQLFEQYMAYCPGVAFMKDAEGRHVYANRLFEETHGLAPGSWAGKLDADLFPPETAARFRAHDLEVLSAGKSLRMIDTQGARSEPEQWLWVKFPFADAAGRQLVAGMAFNITEQHRVEQALAVSEARFRAIFEQSPFSVQIVDRAGRTLLANPAFEALWGVSREVLGEYNLLEDPQAAALGVLPYLRRAFEGEVAAMPPVYYDPAVNGAPGRGRWTEAIFYPVKDAAGAVRELVLMHRDITDRVGFERERAELLAELQETNRRKDEFLATLGHELRNPLAPLITAAELLRLQPAVDPSVRHATEVIARQAQQMRRLIDDLLDVARITRGIVSLHQERLDLRELITEAVHTARPWIDAREHALVLDLPDRPVHADVDRVRIEQVITNLLSNSAKFTARGGRIDIRLEEHGGTAVMRVSDTGKGIPKEMLPRVFDLFTQVDPSLDRAEGGLGLGLTLVNRLVAMHEGSVTVTSPGRGLGTEFTIRLPSRPAPATAPVPSAAPADHQASTAAVRVLVVDDNVDSAEMLGLMLPMWGYTTETAHSPSEALAKTATFRPHVVLLDIGLPGMSGYELAARLRELPGIASVPLVALTGYGQEEDRRRTKEAGFAAHLTKPVDMETLRSLLASLEPNT